jgi:hypothetical protein
MSKQEIELRFKADAAFMERIRGRTDKSPTDIARAALQFYDWATSEIENGRQIQARLPIEDDDQPHCAVFIPEE